MGVIHKDFNEYRMQYVTGGPTDHRAYITCWKDRVAVGTIVFVDDESQLPSNKDYNGRPVLYYPLSRFNDLINILRYEKPLYIWLNTDNLMGNIGTTLEPVGEQEGV
jgi:hypothetical protein